jgi:hypothetical protein
MVVLSAPNNSVLEAVEEEDGTSEITISTGRT